MAKLFGYNFPFFKGKTALGSTSSVLPRQEDYRLIRNDYLQGLMTLHGERVFRPTFGANIGNYLFDQNDSVSRQDLEASIRRYTIKYHPNITVTSINIEQSITTPNMMAVTILGYTNLDSTNTDQLLAEFMLKQAG